MEYKQWNNHKNVVERIFIKGNLTLKTPAHFGRGEEGQLAAITLAHDVFDPNTPLLPGASIAGALRNELRERQLGYFGTENPGAKEKTLAEKLFGHQDDVADGQKRASVESWLMVEDALGTRISIGEPVEVRDGVAINPKTRTVDENERGGKKFDLELLSAGTTFELSFEFWLPKDQPELLAALAAALQGFEKGHIRLGMRKSRGFGLAEVTGWEVWRYSMAEKQDVVNWLQHPVEANKQTGSEITTLLGVTNLPPDQRESFDLAAAFKLQTSLLIGMDGVEEDDPDTIHLQTWRDGKRKPVLSGTSMAGVIRSRASRIAVTVLGEIDGKAFVDEVFGKRIENSEDKATASAVRVEETLLGETLEGEQKEVDFEDLVQNRVKIDRFTSGAYPQALFSQKPVWGGADVTVRLSLKREFGEEEEQFKAKAGLLLLVLKDLWTQDLAIGGESSVGRGRLKGQMARLQLDGETIELTEANQGQLEISPENAAILEDCVAAFNSLGSN